jgi:diguanylate cyclase (GGDEF)-like protein
MLSHSAACPMRQSAICCCFAAIMFDLDRFKAINDRHGHAVGDAVIMKFCEVTVTVLRPTDLFARMGGEEFVILVPAAGIEAACMRAERIRISFADSAVLSMAAK